MANVEVMAGTLQRRPPRAVAVLPVQSGDLWFGVIHRRLPGDPISAVVHDVPFAARYGIGRPTTVWVDMNLNGSLADEMPLRLWRRGGRDSSTACLFDLVWNVDMVESQMKVSWKVRLILEDRGEIYPGHSSELPQPQYRIQLVDAPVAMIPWAGTDSVTTFLFDGNHDGLYTREYGDGAFIDVNSDRSFRVDLMSPEFVPFTVPALVGRDSIEVLSVQKDGSSVTWMRLESGHPVEVAAPGRPTPEFAVQTTDGAWVRPSDFAGRPWILYFWASWCPSCRALAPGLERLEADFRGRGLGILGVTYDDDSTAFARYLSDRPEPWPQYYAGRRFWENPMGRLYGAHAAGSAYLIDPTGKLDGIYYDIEELRSRLTDLLARTAPKQLQSPRNE